MTDQPQSGPLHLAAGGRARAVCVLVHGRGQSPEDMQAHILARLAAPDVAFILPRAAGGSWYDAKAVDPLTTETRAALGLALDHLAADVAAARADHPGLPLVLAGFSQGACLSLEHAFTGEAVADAVLAFTGCRVGQATDVRPRALPFGLPVYLTGGDADPWIPVSAFAEAAAELGTQGAKLRADVFPGRAHEVSAPERAMLASVLGALAHDRPVTMEAPR